MKYKNHKEVQGIGSSAVDLSRKQSLIDCIVCFVTHGNLG